ncbi:MAG: 4-alpha-glucanotransferase [Dysgonamonadaceae bacterium]|nr:4-alpha-glucanotransferase [Dysgonamonadaceae bacterium]
MKISFNINFHTVWGQTLYITGSIPELGSWNVSKACPMSYKDDGNWSLTIELPDKAIHFEYRYFLSSDNQLIFEEWQKNHRLNIRNTNRAYFLYDYWQNKPQNQLYYSSAFVKSFFAHPHSHPSGTKVKSNKKIVIKVLAPRVGRGQSLGICGNQALFGNWDVRKSPRLDCSHFPEWRIEFDASQLTYPIAYKFCILDNRDKSLISWEKGDDRMLNLPLSSDNEVRIISGLQFRECEPEWKCAGLVLPVFAMRSNDSFGIGDMSDLCLMLAWAKKTSQRIIQILPVNDTTMTHTWKDSYPYNILSVNALHPLYLNLFKMGQLKNKDRMSFYRQKQEELNGLTHIDYEQVDKYKWMYFNELYAQEGRETLNSPDFIRFFDENKEWLTPYAAYSFLREKYRTPDFHQWGQYARYHRTDILQLCDSQSPHYDEIALHYYLQYHLHKQLSEARDYAHANGLILKGDIPIGVAKWSVETWTDPDYFNLQLSSGAPPDDFSATGQNWGFPTYNWEIMEERNFIWWKKRFCRMADYFDAYRIDHILGFFRIWEIPYESLQGLCGWFNPALPLSASELEHTGFDFVKEKYTIPRINERFLSEIFGQYAEKVSELFLQPAGSHYYRLKSTYDSQRKIATHFSSQTDSESEIIKKGLLSIANEVLFIEDPRKSDHFHPRIAASTSYVYRELSKSDRYAFDFLSWDYFYQRHNEFWKTCGYKRLSPLANCTDMLACGEDLGMIPQSVPEVMRKLRILSLELERMPKEMNREFTDLKALPYHSVCTTSTHDMATIRGWWKENREKTQRYYNQVLNQEGIAPETCPPEICRQILFNHLNAPSMLVIIPLQDWLAIDADLRAPDAESERINIPADPDHYWRYRMHLTIEELLEAEQLNVGIRELISGSERDQA